MLGEAVTHDSRGQECFTPYRGWLIVTLINRRGVTLTDTEVG